MVVRQSPKNSDVHLYYTAAGPLYLCVVVSPADGQERFVVTAPFTRVIKKGRQVWTS